MIIIFPCANLEPDKRFRVTIDLTNNGLGCKTVHFRTIDEALAYVQEEMNRVVPM